MQDAYRVLSLPESPDAPKIGTKRGTRAGRKHRRHDYWPRERMLSSYLVLDALLATNMLYSVGHQDTLDREIVTVTRRRSDAPQMVMALLHLMARRVQWTARRLRAHGICVVELENGMRRTSHVYDISSLAND